MIQYSPDTIVVDELYYTQSNPTTTNLDIAILSNMLYGYLEFTTQADNNIKYCFLDYPNHRANLNTLIPMILKKCPSETKTISLYIGDGINPITLLSGLHHSISGVKVLRGDTYIPFKNFQKAIDKKLDYLSDRATTGKYLLLDIDEYLGGVICNEFSN